MAKVKKKSDKTRVLIVDDHPVVREGLALRIDRQPDLEVCGEAGDLPSALRSCAELCPHVAVIDIALKDANGIDLIKRLKARGDAAHLLVWSMYHESLYAERALRAGALGYISKDQPTERILEAIRTVREGKIYLSQSAADRLVQRAVGARPSTQASLDLLSDRELEVFRFVGEGLSPVTIAQRLHLSPKTVETYQARIKEKLKLDNGRELILQAVQWVGDLSRTPGDDPAG